MVTSHLQAALSCASSPDNPFTLKSSMMLSIHFCLRDSFVSTSQPLLCKPAEARVTKWQEQWEATQSNNRNMTSTQKNNSRVVTHCRGIHGGRPTECARDRLPPRQRNICGLPGEQNLYVRRGHMWSWPHYDELPTFRGETKQRWHGENGEWSCAMDDRRCRHNNIMMTSAFLPSLPLNASIFISILTTCMNILSTVHFKLSSCSFFEI